MVTVAYSSAFSQAIAILLHISIKTDKCMYEFLSTKNISEHLNIPVPTAIKVLKSLNATGITITKEGAKGGILLAKSPSEITLLDVFLAIEPGRPLFKKHFNLNVNSEVVEDLKQKVSLCLLEAETAMKDSLKKVTLYDLMH